MLPSNRNYLDHRFSQTRKNLKTIKTDNNTKVRILLISSSISQFRSFCKFVVLLHKPGFNTNTTTTSSIITHKKQIYKQQQRTDDSFTINSQNNRN